MSRGAEFGSDELFTQWLERNNGVNLEALVKALYDDHPQEWTLVEILTYADKMDLYAWLAMAFFRCLDRAYDPDLSKGGRAAIAFCLRPRTIAYEAWRALKDVCNHANVGYQPLANIIQLLATDLAHTSIELKDTPTS